MEIIAAISPRILNFLIRASVGFSKIDAAIIPIINGKVYFIVPDTSINTTVNTPKKIKMLTKGLTFLTIAVIYSIFILSTFLNLKIKGAIFK